MTLEEIEDQVLRTYDNFKHIRKVEWGHKSIGCIFPFGPEHSHPDHYVARAFITHTNGLTSDAAFLIPKDTESLTKEQLKRIIWEAQRLVSLATRDERDADSDQPVTVATFKAGDEHYLAGLGKTLEKGDSADMVISDIGVIPC